MRYLRNNLLTVALLAFAMLLPFFVLSASDSLAAAENVYVSSSGSDVSGDGSEAAPYATINKACTACPDGGTVVLLSDISQSSYVSLWKSLTIKSRDGEGPYTIKRASGFSVASDPARRQYNPAMFELHADAADRTLTLKNIVIDDDHRSEGTSFTLQNTNGSGGNQNKVQDAIIAVYQTGNNSTVILDEGAKLQNYGGIAAVAIFGGKSRLVMESGSSIRETGSAASKGYGAVYNSYAIFDMKAGAVIDNVQGNVGPAIYSRYGNNSINGTVSNCRGIGSDYAVIDLAGGTNEIGSDAVIRDNTTRHGTIYVIAGAVLTVRGEICNNITDNQNTWCSGIYAADNGAPATVYIEDGAYIHDNRAFQYRYSFLSMDSPYVSAVLANNRSFIIMNGGRIVNNKTPYGVKVRKNGSFVMNGGEVSGNGAEGLIATLTNYRKTDIHIENYMPTSTVDIASGRVELNGGTVAASNNELSIVESEAGFKNGSFMKLGRDVIAGTVKLSYEKVEFRTLSSLTYPYHTVLKTITPDPSMNGIYLGNASTSGKAALNAVPEITAGTLLTTWYGASADGLFKLKVEGLAYNDGDLFACIVPVDADGNALSGYRIFPCDKKQSGSAMTVDMTVAGFDNAPGYAFALFANPAMPARTYTLHYDTDGGETVSDKTGLTFDSKDLAPQKDPVKAKHDFIGWYMDKGYTREYKPENSYADIVFNDVAATEATLYAKFEPVSYSFTEGNGNVWTVGSGISSDFTVKRNRLDAELTFKHSSRVLVDGKELSASDATLTEGSLKIALKPAFLETLAPGEHQIKAEFSDGEASASFTVLKNEDKRTTTAPTTPASTTPDDSGDDDNSKSNSSTGDSNHIRLMIVLFILSLVLIISKLIISQRNYGKKNGNYLP